MVKPSKAPRASTRSAIEFTDPKVSGPYDTEVAGNKSADINGLAFVGGNDRSIGVKLVFSSKEHESRHVGVRLAIDDVYASKQVYDFLDGIFNLPARAGEAVSVAAFSSYSPLQKSKRDEGKLIAGWDLYPSNRVKVTSLAKSRLGAKWGEGLEAILASYGWKQ